ncbi:cilia- and flagella-associated protein 251-like [Entelurus aequoreus]|uniref:cilia- and flagella-associated protein 251-like n=1 Tax=Entelurus aequoreus TaxID=161455 RepID=UPI002B1E50A1|nr:cilia- and flagella-associated protein 251-like [Entelurus aequoreus]
MLTRWLTFIALLAASVYAGVAAVGHDALTVVPTSRVEGQPEVQVTVKCGDGKKAGVVAYWHTPFGHLQTPGFHARLDPVYMHHDGSLVVTKLSSLHEGLYYCLLRHDGGSTLFPYQLCKRPEDVGQEHFRFRRELGSVAEEQENVSDRLLAGAVAASVLLTFVFGFSAGALSRRNVLRCWTGLTKILPASSPRQQRDLSDADITMATLSSMHNKMEQVTDDETTSSLGSNPPAKPQRSFRERREAQAYWEACDRVEGRSIEEARGRLEECDGKVREVRPSGQDKDEEGMSRKEEEDGEVGGFDGRIEDDHTGEKNDDGENERKEDDEKDNDEDEKENEVDEKENEVNEKDNEVNEKNKKEKVKKENEVDEKENEADEKENEVDEKDNEEDEKEKNEVDEKEKNEVDEKEKNKVDEKEKNKVDEKLKIEVDEKEKNELDEKEKNEVDEKEKNKVDEKEKNKVDEKLKIEVDEKEKNEVDEKEKNKVDEKEKNEVDEKEKNEVDEKEKNKVDEKEKNKVDEKEKIEVDEKEKIEVDEKEKNEVDEKKNKVDEKEKIDVDVKKNKEDEKGEKSNDEDGGADVSSESLSSQTDGDDDGGEDKKEELSSSQVSPSRSSRVIRLYQYDEDGRRYGHLPDPGPEEPGPAPKLKQRSASLTRLNAIMAAASAGPLDTPPRGQEGSARTETTHFGMDI